MLRILLCCAGIVTRGRMVEVFFLDFLERLWYNFAVPDRN